MIDFGFGVELRTIDAKDSQDLRYWRNQYPVWRHCRQSDLISETHHGNWMEWQAKDPNTRMYAIYSDGALVGVCGLTSIDWLVRKAEFSLYIGPEHQGQHLSTKALRTLFSHGFQNMNLNLIWGESFNPKALRVFEKIGMKTEGVRRDFYFKEGRYLDATLISIRRDEWSSVQQV
jgi:diamine N-acetyltransferase